MIKDGYGRRRIAKAFGITEWAARHLMHDVVNQVTDLSDKKAKRSKPRPRVGKASDLSVVERKRTKKTQVKITAEVKTSDVRTRLETRPTSMKVAVISDIHYPYEDKQCIKLTKAYLKDYNPDMIVMNGDIADCYSVSRYEKNMKGRLDLQGELDYTEDRLWEWVEEFPDTEFKYLEGNHEERLKKYLAANAASLLSMRGLDFPERVNLEEMGIEWIPVHKDMQIGDLLFTHGHYARKHAGASARGHFESYGCSLLIGHVHRLSIGWKRNKQGHHAMIENGTLCDFDVEYLKFPDWQHGFTTIDFDGDDFAPSQHAIIDYKLIADGKVYTV